MDFFFISSVLLFFLMYSALYKIFKGSAQGKLRGSYLKALGKRGRSIRKAGSLANVRLERNVVCGGKRVRIKILSDRHFIISQNVIRAILHITRQHPDLVAIFLDLSPRRSSEATTYPYPRSK